MMALFHCRTSLITYLDTWLLVYSSQTSHHRHTFCSRDRRPSDGTFMKLSRVVGASMITCCVPLA